MFPFFINGESKMRYWLAKTDPDTYSFDKFESEISTVWDGVRNYQARNYLNEMQIGDLVLIYHSQTSKDIVGITEVTKSAFQDPTTDDERWFAVELTFKSKLKKSVTLNQLKNDDLLKNIPLIKQSRLSVMPLYEQEYNRIMELSN